MDLRKKDNLALTQMTNIQPLIIKSMNEVHVMKGTRLGKYLACAFAAAAFLCVPAFGASGVTSDSEVQAQQQRKTATGIVVDKNGEGIVGAGVVVKGTNNGTVTGVDGSFSIANVAEGSVLQISSIGYKTVEVVWNGQNVNVVLEDSSEFLSESVVVGYGVQKKESLTAAVSTVDVEKALNGRPIPDVGRGLQGAAPGLNVRIGSNEVGSDPIFRIRGQVGSLNGSNSPLILLDNVEIPSINLINPDDIESVSVLKDAASASIYGAKGAFGVILITTKKGAKEAETVHVTYSGNLSFQNMAKNYKVGDVEALHYTVEASERTGNFNPTGAFWLIDRAGYNAAVAWKEKYGSTLSKDAPMTYGRDWYVGSTGAKIGVRTYDPYHYLVRKNAPTQTHNISVSGNKGNTNYNISLAYLNQSGMLKPTDYDGFKRYNANVRLNTQINKWLNVHAGLMFTKATKSWAFATNSTTADIWYYVFRWGPTYPLVPVDEYGNNVRTAAYEVATAHKATIDRIYNSVNVGTTITPLKDWSIKVDYTYARSTSEEKNPGITYMAGDTWVAPVNALKNGATFTVPNEWASINGLGDELTAKQLKVYSYTSTYDSIYQDSFSSQRQTWNITSDYALKLNEDHNFNFLVGFNAVGYDYSGVWGKRMTLLNKDNPQFDLAVGTQTSGGSYSWNSTAGFFGRINYNYKEKYLIEANLRYDGSSKFPTALKWRWFPSVSAAWRVSQEPWMQGVKDIVSSLKLRASWGSIGDQTVPSSLYIPTMGSITDYWMHGSSRDYSFATPGLVAADITWQDIETLDFGTDFSLFNQVNVTFDWFRRTTKNMIIPMGGTGYNLGASAPSGNYGALRTNGWELSVNWGHSFDNGLHINATATIADAKTKITEYDPDAKGINGWYQGKTYGEIWGYRVDRLFQWDDFEGGKTRQLVTDTDKYGKIYKFAAGKDYATQGRITSGNLISGPGDVKFKDLNGDGVIDYGNSLTDDHGDLTVIGNTTPRYEYSLRLDADYKGFDFSILFQGIGKRNMWGSSSMTLPGFNTGDGSMANTFVKDFWYETLDGNGQVIDANYDAYYPRAANLGNTSSNTAGFNMVINDKYMLNMAYLRIKNITVGYTLPTNLVRKASIERARVYVSLENFFTFDHLRGLPIDPEEIAGYSYLNSSNYNSSRAGIGTPAFKTASVGIQVTF